MIVNPFASSPSYKKVSYYYKSTEVKATRIKVPMIDMTNTVYIVHSTFIFVTRSMPAVVELSFVVNVSDGRAVVEDKSFVTVQCCNYGEIPTALHTCADGALCVDVVNIPASCIGFSTHVNMNIYKV